MRAITVDEVYAAVAAVLAEPRATAASKGNFTA
jgi:hypothetical protein